MAWTRPWRSLLAFRASKSSHSSRSDLLFSRIPIGAATHSNISNLAQCWSWSFVPEVHQRRTMLSIVESRFASSQHRQEIPQGKSTGDPALANTSILSCCHREEDFDDARRLYEQMKEQEVKPDPSCFYTLLDGSCKFGSADDVLAVIKDMKECGISPDGRAYSFLITSYAKSGMIDKASEIFQTLRSSKARIENTLYSTMVWLYCQADRPKDAESFLKMMEEDGTDRDAISYNVVISAYERTGRYAEAIRIFQGMKNRKKALGQSTYKLMLNVYLKAGEHDAFNKMFKKMLRSDIFGDRRTLEAAIDFYASKRMSTDAEWLYDNLARVGIRVSVTGYNKLLELFLAVGNTSMVDRIYREMSRVGTPDRTTRHWVLTAYLRAQCFQGAVEVHEQMLKEGDGVQPLLDPGSFEMLVRAYVKSRRFFEAMKLVVHMRQAGMKLDEEVYNQVVAGMVSVDERAG